QPCRHLRQLPRHRRPRGQRLDAAAAGRHAARLPAHAAEGVQGREPPRDHHAPAVQGLYRPAARTDRRLLRRATEVRGPTMQRRSFLQSSSALALLGLAGCATTSIPSKARVVVVGGGYGGATAAKYVRLLSA